MRKNIALLFVFMILLSGIVFAEVYSVSTCCEKTNEGAWCQNAPEEECNSAFRLAPTHCESTSYCKLGTCYDGNAGNCMENTPQRVCDEAEGIWTQEENPPQCQLGCCLIGDQAAFVTKTRCKKMSTLYGLEVDYRLDMGSEMQCIASAYSEVKGACVFEEEFENVCKVITKRECLNMNTAGTETEFYEERLCTDPTLGTICAKQKKTTCVDGKDEVYFVDSCGNVANVYDSTLIDDSNYWSEMYTAGESCGFGQGNADSSTCGNCNYYLGSTCKEYDRGEDDVRPNFGDNICRDLSCEHEGQSYEHGETWCASVEGVSKIEKKAGDVDSFAENLPGSRYFRMLCYNGDVTVEPCSDFRQEVCLESEVNSFSAAACVVNRWQDCTAQDRQKDCDNTDRRDCMWLASGDEIDAKYDDKGQKISGGEIACVPRYAPGFDFWNSEGQTDEACALASKTCLVSYEKGLLSGEECAENCECLEDAWEAEQNQMCVSLGDCGTSTNHIGIPGFNEDDEVIKITEVGN